MANNVTITIAARDEASKALANLNNNISRLGTTGAMAQGQIASLSEKLAVARARYDEASTSGKAKTSTLLNLQRQVQSYESQLHSSISAESKQLSMGSRLNANWLTVTGAVAAAGFSINAFTGFMSRSIDAANRYQMAMIGLARTSSAYGQDAAAAKQAAKDLTSDGLLSLGTAAEGLQKLFAAGVGLPQAVELMNGYKNQAAFGRSSTIGFEQAVLNLTESFYTENSAIGNLSGQTENWEMILQKGAAALGKNVEQLSEAERVEAKLIGQRMLNTVVTGNAQKMAGTYAGAQARAATETEKTKQSIGELTQVMTGGLLGAFAEFLNHNRAGVVSFGAAAVAVTVLGGAMYGLARAFLVVRGVLAAGALTAALNPFVLGLTALAAIAGVVVYKAMNKMQDKVGQANEKLAETGKNMGSGFPPQASKAAKAAEDLAKKLADIGEQMTKANRDFQENMAEMVKSHQDKVSSLKSQITEESDAFQKAADREAADFAAAQADMAAEHEKRTGKIQNQLDNELALGKWADQQKVRDLQEQLATEIAEYDAQALEKKTAYEQDVADNKTAHDKKLLDLQTQLDGENALLTKHAADVAGIRNVTLLDEIDKLKRSHDEQMIAFQRQKDDAIKNATETANGVQNVWNGANDSLNTQFSGMGNSMGTQMGAAFKSVLKESFKEVGRDMLNWMKEAGLAWGRLLETTARTFSNLNIVNLVKNKGNVLKIFQEEWDRSVIGGSATQLGARAAGGPVSAGRPYLVGERGPELVVPSRSGTVIPADETARVLGSGGGITINQTNHNYSMFDLMAANRELGYQLQMRAA